MATKADVDESFDFFESYYEGIARIPDAEAGRLIKALCAFVFFGEDADFSDAPYLGLVYDIFKRSAYYSLKAARASKANGEKSAEARRQKAASLSAIGDTISLIHAVDKEFGKPPRTPKRNPLEGSVNEKKRMEENGTEVKFSSKSGAGAANAAPPPLKKIDTSDPDAHL